MNDATEDRKIWMGLLARASAADLADRLGALDRLPQAHDLRAPEIGGVMVRGRIGGTGQPFNLGEMTVTRCSLRLESGEVGHGYVQGRDKTKARNAALVDAMMQTVRAGEIRASVLAPLAEAQAARDTARAAKAAATKAEFFTMVRGEDQ
ncbi:phosphonate C-P lyase system protein PhnG [Aliiruegeria lutimaris]|uniref:Alpha-D-ribose 1-methylphosphonate 5-triphosphate synthase subunit PhnG n=1 Tax=Aliiruegeria lutimaris TaxID=571298 RepID=A0A1G9BX56_9RHOB|nr:phosphonate C-P lyase system protein PhnG [Aliiruegeria lutimaris]SDK44039.1 alpha-D-ribose 1-methylphosphonate 5-triphosphate synthase subunit PhnG [Aliiruegeria lutimaris]